MRQKQRNDGVRRLCHCRVFLFNVQRMDTNRGVRLIFSEKRPMESSLIQFCSANPGREKRNQNLAARNVENPFECNFSRNEAFFFVYSFQKIADFRRKIVNHEERGKRVHWTQVYLISANMILDVIVASLSSSTPVSSWCRLPSTRAESSSKNVSRTFHVKLSGCLCFKSFPGKGRKKTWSRIN